MTLFTTSRPTISVKSVTRYPTRITTGTGLSYTYTNGTLNISLDYSDIPDSAQIADPANYTTVVYNKTTGLLEEVQLDYIPTTVVTDPVYTRGDSNFTIPSDYRVLSLVANLTASRTWTLPLAADVTSGNRIFIYDTVGGISATNTLVIAAPSGNTINGASSITLSNAFAGITIVSNSGTQWTAILTNVDSVGGLGTNVANAMKQPVNAASGLVRLDSSGNVPALNGAALTSLNASNISSGTVPAARLPGPTLSTIGGVKAKAAETSKFVNQIDTDGSVNLAQPAVGDISGFGTGVATFLATPSSANLASAVTDETGTGALVFANSPTLVTPALGTPASGNLANCTFPTLNQNTTGTAAGLSATLGVASGGTGLTSLTAGYIPYGNGTGAFSSSGNLTFDGNTLTVTGASVPAVFNRTDNVALISLQYNGTQGGYIGSAGAGITTFYDNYGIERMRIASDGSVGIGTTGPASYGKFAVVNGVGAFVNSGLDSALSTTLAFQHQDYGTTYQNLIRSSVSADPNQSIIAFSISSGANSTTEVMRLQGGNLGLGVTPSAWVGGYKAIQFGDTGVIYNSSGANNYYGSNAYYDGVSLKRITANAAGLLGVEGNTFAWYQAASGTAGTTINFTQAMTLDASGNLGIGTSSPSTKLQTYAASSSLQIISSVRNDNSGAGVAAIGFDVSTSGESATGSIKGGIGFQRGYAYGGGALCFYNNNSGASGNFTTSDEKMRLDASGNLGIGTSSPAAKLDLTGSSLPYMNISYSGVGTLQLGVGTGGASVISSTAGPILFKYASTYTGSPYSTGTTLATLDVNGNLGLGVTPSAWGGGKAIEVGGSGSGLWWYGSTSLYNTMNCRFDGTSWKYGATGQASLYLQSAGQHIWNTAASGTAGTAISFTQAMTLTAAGELLVGTTSSPTSAKVKVSATPTSKWGIDFSECSVSIASGGNATIPAGAGLITITDGTNTGSTGVYVLGGATAVFINGAGSTVAFVASTTSPASGKASIAWDGSSSYRIYNNQGSTITYTLSMLQTRTAV